MSSTPKGEPPLGKSPTGVVVSSRDSSVLAWSSRNVSPQGKVHPSGPDAEMTPGALGKPRGIGIRGSGGDSVDRMVVL
jgi:hypothetical protein